MAGDEDLGLDITMKGERYHIAQKDLAKSKVPVNQKLFATGMNGDEDLGLDIIMDGEHYHIVQTHGQAPPDKSFFFEDGDKLEYTTSGTAAPEDKITINVAGEAVGVDGGYYAMASAAPSQAKDVKKDQHLAQKSMSLND